MNLEDYERIILTHGCPLCSNDELNGLHVFETVPDENGGTIGQSDEKVLNQALLPCGEEGKDFQSQ